MRPSSVETARSFAELCFPDLIWKYRMRWILVAGVGITLYFGFES